MNILAGKSLHIALINSLDKYLEMELLNKYLEMELLNKISKNKDIIW